MRPRQPGRNKTKHLRRLRTRSSAEARDAAPTTKRAGTGAAPTTKRAGTGAAAVPASQLLDSRQTRKIHLLVRQAQARRAAVVFTNGVFDILHVGHTRYLAAARRMGDLLVVGLNSDASTRRIKGPLRPIVPARERAEMLLALKCVDCVIIFHAPTPARLIEALKPQIIVKGADWASRDIVGGSTVRAHGGRVARVRLAPGQSTTAIIRRIAKRYAQ